MVFDEVNIQQTSADDNILTYFFDVPEEEPVVPTPTLILGIGSPFADDKAAWQAVDQLLFNPQVREAVAAKELVVHKLDRPGMALLEYFQGFEHVVIVDALRTEHYNIGAWIALAPEELALLAAPASTHGLGVAEALAMAEALNVLPQRLEVWGIVVR